MTAEKTRSRPQIPVISRRLAQLLAVVFLLFALLVVNSLYLVIVTILEQASGEIYQDYFYMLMFLIHLLILFLRGINPVTYVQKAWPALVFAFSSRILFSSSRSRSLAFDPPWRNSGPAKCFS